MCIPRSPLQLYYTNEDTQSSMPKTAPKYNMSCSKTSNDIEM